MDKKSGRFGFGFLGLFFGFLVFLNLDGVFFCFILLFSRGFGFIFPFILEMPGV